MCREEHGVVIIRGELVFKVSVATEILRKSLHFSTENLKPSSSIGLEQTAALLDGVKILVRFLLMLCERSTFYTSKYKQIKAIPKVIYL